MVILKDSGSESPRSVSSDSSSVSSSASEHDPNDEPAPPVPAEEPPKVSYPVADVHESDTLITPEEENDNSSVSSSSFSSSSDSDNEHNTTLEPEFQKENTSIQSAVVDAVSVENNEADTTDGNPEAEGPTDSPKDTLDASIHLDAVQVEQSPASDDTSDAPFSLQSSYPKLPPAPVDALISLRLQSRQDELKISDDLLQQEVASARTHLQELEAKSSRQKNKLSASTNSFAIPLPSASPTDAGAVSCRCGNNVDDGRTMVQCEDCLKWEHVLCIGEPPSRVQDPTFRFFCLDCEWEFRCVCGIRAKNHDDGSHMICCDFCKNWLHSFCVKVDPNDPPETYKCPRCKKAGSRRLKQRKEARERKKKDVRPPPPPPTTPPPPPESSPPPPPPSTPPPVLRGRNTNNSRSSDLTFDEEKLTVVVRPNLPSSSGPSKGLSPMSPTSPGGETPRGSNGKRGRKRKPGTAKSRLEKKLRKRRR